ncbi:MAG: dihydrofolate reductase [Pseudomonadota bacterium]
MKLSIIAALTDEGVIGFRNRLPWHLPEDLKRFKKLTMGRPVVMGRKTFESLKEPLPGRSNIVVTRNPAFRPKGVHTASSLEEALRLARAGQSPEIEEVFVIGGAELFREALPKADRLYLTFIHKSYAGDAFFPARDHAKGFRETERSECVSLADPGLTFSFVTLERASIPAMRGTGSDGRTLPRRTSR